MKIFLCPSLAFQVTFCLLLVLQSLIVVSSFIVTKFTRVIVKCPYLVSKVCDFPLREKVEVALVLKFPCLSLTAFPIFLVETEQSL